jgi:hypothetical protein
MTTSSLSASATSPSKVSLRNNQRIRGTWPWRQSEAFTRERGSPDRKSEGKPIWDEPIGKTNHHLASAEEKAVHDRKNQPKAQVSFEIQTARIEAAGSPAIEKVRDSVQRSTRIA